MNRQGFKLGNGRTPAMSEACMTLYSDLLLALKGRTFVSSDFSTEETSISASPGTQLQGPLSPTLVVGWAVNTKKSIYFRLLRALHGVEWPSLL